MKCIKKERGKRSQLDCSFLKIVFSTFISVTLFSLAKPPVYASTYYVSPTGDDSALGTIGAPWKTLTKAGSTATAGDTVYIREGTYYERLSVDNSGTAENYLTFSNYNGETVLIDAQNGTRTSGVSIIGKSYIQIIGVTVTGANQGLSPKSGVFVGDGSSHIIIDNVTAYGNWYGIRLYGNVTPVTNITVKNSQTYLYDQDTGTHIGNMQHGVFVYRRVHDSTIGPHNRLAYNAGMPAGSEDSYGIEVGTADADDQTYSPQRIVIYDNEIDHNEVQGIRTWNASDVQIANNYTHDNGATGIQIEDGSRNIVIENNLSEHNAQLYEYETGAWVDSATNVLVRDNVLRSNKIGLNITDSARVIAHHNYIYDNNTGAVDLLNAGGLVVNDLVDNIYVIQNTLHHNGDVASQRGGVSFCIKNNTCDNITFVNNIVSATASHRDLHLGYPSRYLFDHNNYDNSRPLSVHYLGSVVDWPTYLAGSLQDTNSITSSPLFVDPSSHNYALQSSSQAIDKGMFLTKTIGSGHGTSLTVDDAGYFSDGIFNAPGDTIRIGNVEATITDIDYQTNTIAVDKNISWSHNESVTLAYFGLAPDIGASEFTPTPPNNSPQGITRLRSTSFSSPPSAPTCRNIVSANAPDLFEIRTTRNSATLYFAPPRMPYSNFYVAFSRKPDIWEYGTQYDQAYSSGVLSYTVYLLDPNTKYYFMMRSGNGCAAGKWGNTMSAITSTSNRTRVFYRSVQTPLMPLSR